MLNLVSGDKVLTLNLRRMSMFKKKLLRVKFILLGFVFIISSSIYAESITDISVQQAKKMIDSKDYGVILDVRTVVEYTGDLGHIDGAILIPVQELKERTGEIVKYKDAKVLVICHSGVRSRKASDILLQKGFSKVYNITDGMAGWNSQKYPVKK